MLHQIGVGALGPVFRTYEPERDRLVAVKAFRLDITPEQARTLADELSRAAESGLFHPSIVEPIAAGVEGTLAYCADEYVAAESLDVAMRHYAPAPIATVLPYITQLAGAIDFARVAGVGHGALHPRDIFITPEEARVTGFGVVEALERVGFRAPVRRPYSPPERIAGEAWGATADVFSLAAITYELLTGRRPAGLGREIGTLTVGTPNAWMETLHAVLSRAMDAEPKSRYTTALAFASALEAAAHGEDDAAPEAAPPSTARGRRAAAAAAGLRAAAVDPPGPDIPGDSLYAAEIPHKEDDISAERDQDEAEHHLRLRELEQEPQREPELELDDDIQAEAEADRFAGDDFLLDAAGAASAAPELSPGERRRGDPPVGLRALDHDEVVVDERLSPPVEPQDLLQEEKPEPAVRGYQPSFGYQSAVIAEPAPAEPRSSWPVVLTLVAGLAAGLGGGYALWGRAPAPPTERAAAGAASGPAATTSAPAPTGREFSEQAVNPPASSPGAAARDSRGAGAAEPPPVPRESPAERAPVAAPPLRPAPTVSSGTIVVHSVPSGAGVTLNGRWRGRTPLTLARLPLRRHDVRVVQQGFRAATQAVSLSSDTPSRSLSFRLQPQAQARGAAPPETPGGQGAPPEQFTGSLYVDSRPRGARVSIDGKPVGVTPIRVPEVRIGTHVVRLELPDHRLWSTTSTITAGQEQRVTGSLERIQ